MTKNDYYSFRPGIKPAALYLTLAAILIGAGLAVIVYYIQMVESSGSMGILLPLISLFFWLVGLIILISILRFRVILTSEVIRYTNLFSTSQVNWDGVKLLTLKYPREENSSVDDPVFYIEFKLSTNKSQTCKLRFFSFDQRKKIDKTLRKLAKKKRGIEIVEKSFMYSTKSLDMD
ncbi:MAG: hypothetical protein ACFFD4_06075 [Candidatus Odinarchaeota archaeon]